MFGCRDECGLPASSLMRIPLANLDLDGLEPAIQITLDAGKQFLHRMVQVDAAAVGFA